MHPFCLEHLRSLIWGIIVPMCSDFVIADAAKSKLF